MQSVFTLQNHSFSLRDHAKVLVNNCIYGLACKSCERPSTPGHTPGLFQWDFYLSSLIRRTERGLNRQGTVELVWPSCLERHASWVVYVRLHGSWNTVCLLVPEKPTHSFGQQSIQATLCFSVRSLRTRGNMEAWQELDVSLVPWTILLLYWKIIW